MPAWMGLGPVSLGKLSGWIQQVGGQEPSTYTLGTPVGSLFF